MARGTSALSPYEVVSMDIGTDTGLTGNTEVFVGTPGARSGGSAPPRRPRRVSTGRPRPEWDGGLMRWIAASVAVVAAVLLVVVFVSIEDTGSDQVVRGEGEVEVTSEVEQTTSAVESAPPATESVTQPATTQSSAPVTVGATEDAAVWRVVGVTDSLNVRSTPGLDGALARTLPADARGIVGTGEFVTVDNMAWTQIELDGETFWVASQYLAVDDSASSAQTTTVASPNIDIRCYTDQWQGMTRAMVVRIDGANVRGASQWIDADGEIAYDWFTGSVEDAIGPVLLTGAEEAQWTEVWAFEAPGISMSNGLFADVVDCGSLDAAVYTTLASGLD